MSLFSVVAFLFVVYIVAAWPLAKRLYSRLRYRDCLESAIALRYLMLLASVGDGAKFNSVARRRKLVRELEGLAVLLHTEMPRALSLKRGSNVREATEGQYSSAGTFVRQLQTWVTSPQAGTSDALRSELSEGFGVFGTEGGTILSGPRCLRRSCVHRPRPCVGTPSTSGSFSGASGVSGLVASLRIRPFWWLLLG